MGTSNIKTTGLQYLLVKYRTGTLYLSAWRIVNAGMFNVSLGEDPSTRRTNPAHPHPIYLSEIP